MERNGAERTRNGDRGIEKEMLTNQKQGRGDKIMISREHQDWIVQNRVKQTKIIKKYKNGACVG